MARTIQNQVLYIGLATAAIASVLFYIYVSQIDPKKELKEDRTKKGKKESDDTASPTSTPSKEQSTTTQAFDELKTPIVRNSASTKKVIEAPEQTDSLPSPPKASPQTVTDENKAIHGRIEELDKKGKSFFKNKRVRMRDFAMKVKRRIASVWRKVLIYCALFVYCMLLERSVSLLLLIS